MLDRQTLERYYLEYICGLTIPIEYNGLDIKLIGRAGFWFWNVDHHEYFSLYELKTMGFSAEDIKQLPSVTPKPIKNI